MPPELTSARCAGGAERLRAGLPDDGAMRYGLHALGIGSGARRVVIDAVATEAEAAGFTTLWVGEPVVRVGEPDSRSPYSADGWIAVMADADWLDALIGLSFAAAVTSPLSSQAPRDSARRRIQYRNQSAP